MLDLEPPPQKSCNTSTLLPLPQTHRIFWFDFVREKYEMFYYSIGIVLQKKSIYSDSLGKCYMQFKICNWKNLKNFRNSYLSKKLKLQFSKIHLLKIRLGIMVSIHTPMDLAFLTLLCLTVMISGIPFCSNVFSLKKNRQFYAYDLWPCY